MTDWPATIQKRKIEVDGHEYDILLDRKKTLPGPALKIVVVSFQPNENASELLKLCIKSIKKFTRMDYELWIVDNNSPREHLSWLKDVPYINTVYIRTEPAGEASYANGLALEVAIRLIDPDTRYFLSLHEDTVVCRYGWLEYLLSKLDGSIKAAGFRLTRARIPEGVLHVCGYLIDFQLFKDLELSFMPDLPGFDVGDKAIFQLREKGYGIFNTPSTFDDGRLIDMIPKTMEISDLNATRSFNDNDEVVYMHLGRGIPKAKGIYKNREKSSSQQWIEYVRANLFSEPQLQYVDEKFIDRFDFQMNSVRDFYFLDAVNNISGQLGNDRRIAGFGDKISYLKDYLKSIDLIPAENISGSEYDCLFYHDIDRYPDSLKKLLTELSGCLKSGGVLLADCGSPSCSTEAKADPDLKDNLVEALWELGYREVRVKRQGSPDICKFLAEINGVKGKSRDSRKSAVLINRLINRKFKRIVKKDNIALKRQPFNCQGLSAGYTIIAVK